MAQIENPSRGRGIEEYENQGDVVRHWDNRATAGGGGYNNLHWSEDPGLLAAAVKAADVENATYVLDIGTGQGILAQAMASHVGTIIAADISTGMMQLGMPNAPENVQYVQADARSLPVKPESVDVITSRMMFHHLSEQERIATLEAGLQALRSDGHIMLCEYTVPDDECRAFELEIMKKKEKNRPLWTSRGFQTLIQEDLNQVGETCSFERTTVVMEGYSVRNWLENNGKSEQEIQQFFEMYVTASRSVQKKMNIKFKHNNDGSLQDVYVDRQFTQLTLRREVKV